MRIDGNRPPSDANGSSRADGAARPSHRGMTAPGRADRVDVSHQAKKVQEIVAQAVQAATTTEVRSDAVERGRRLLESGELGRDSARLASALINDLVDRP